MRTHRLSHSFSAGELSPLLDSRVDFKRYNNGCSKLRNMESLTQGPATRRSGFRYIYDINSIGLDTTNPLVRLIPFTFNEDQAYALLFYMHTDGDIRMVIGDQEGLVVYSNPVPDFCPPIPYEVAYTGIGTYDIPIDIGASIEVEVRHTAADDTETVLVETTDYTITINADPTADTINVTGGPTDSAGTLDFYLKTTASPGDIVTLTFPTGWDIENFDWAQSADEIYIAQSGLPPHVIKRHGHTCWEIVELTFTDQPVDWSDDYGWPERVTFHQQRLVYAANLLKRQTVWMSKAGSFYDFGQSGTIVDSDAVSFTLDSGTQNKIVWMLSGKSLNIGTIGNEWTVTGSTRAALTPENILAQRQTNNGSEANKALMVGITTLFVEKYGRVINEFVYDYTLDSYKTSDMSVLSSHVTEKYSILDWTFQQTPNSIIWSIRSDGYLLGITYQRQHEVIGWHVHDTDGEFKAITSTPGDTREDEVWTVVKRVIAGADKYYLEKKEIAFLDDDAISARFLDSFVEYSGVATNTLYGLAHLEGKEIDIIADGTVHPPQTVVGGLVTLNEEYENIAGGLGYISEIWPNLSDVRSESGTGLGRMQRVINIDIDLYKSLGMYVGTYDSEDGESEEEIAFRVPGNLTGIKVPLYTGIVHLGFKEGYDRKSTYFIKQKQPLPLTIRAVIDTVEVQE